MRTERYTNNFPLDLILEHKPAIGAIRTTELNLINRLKLVGAACNSKAALMHVMRVNNKMH